MSVLHIIIAIIGLTALVALIVIGRRQKDAGGMKLRSPSLGDIKKHTDEEFDNYFGSADDGIVSKARVISVNEEYPGKTQYTEDKSVVEESHFAVYVLAPEGAHFGGYDLLQALTSVGLQFGKMSIFHYYDEDNPKQVLFSVASATEPGTIDVNEIGSFTCGGLCLFMSVSNNQDPAKALSAMLGSAQCLVDELQGGLFDRQGKALSQETVEAWYKQVELQSARQIEMMC